MLIMICVLFFFYFLKRDNILKFSHIYDQEKYIYFLIFKTIEVLCKNLLKKKS